MPLGYPTQAAPSPTVSGTPMGIPYGIAPPGGRYGYYSDPPMSPTTHRPYHPPSPDSQSATSSSNNNNNNNPSPPTALATPHLLPSHQPLLVTPLSPRFSNPTTERVKETIARANSVPMEFYHTEFLEYSKETYEKKKQIASKRSGCMINPAASNKRKRGHAANESASAEKKQKLDAPAEETAADEEEEDEDDDENGPAGSGTEDNEVQLNTAELRRQVHIQSEQKRRAQIKDGFDELRKYLPGCNNKKMSKASLLTRTVQQLQHLKTMQVELLEEVERLMQENENLKKFQHGVLQRQAMEKMYAI
ncbi:hypothetical protein BX666DRAFT_665997 [Dichotomocladium elegans]|nr:hypothetical protein BX666DRAFT_665997 [Dichotomocladium elegans]